MKQIIISGLFLLFISCKSNNVITTSEWAISEKEQVLAENNSCFSTVSIIGGAANAAKEEADKLRQAKIEEREKALKSIEGLNVSTVDDGNGNVSFKAVVQNDLLFAFDSFELSDEAKSILDKIVPVIEEIPETKVKIIGHTDNVGDKSYNMDLSLNRAKAVGEYLVNAGIPKENIREIGKGFSMPVSDNDTEEGRAKNRRVELYIKNDMK